MVFPVVLCPLFCCETRIGIGVILCRFNTREGVTGVFRLEYPMVCLRSLLFWTADFLLESALAKLSAAHSARVEPSVVNSFTVK